MYVCPARSAFFQAPNVGFGLIKSSSALSLKCKRNCNSSPTIRSAPRRNSRRRVALKFYRDLDPDLKLQDRLNAPIAERFARHFRRRTRKKKADNFFGVQVAETFYSSRANKRNLVHGGKKCHVLTSKKPRAMFRKKQSDKTRNQVNVEGQIDKLFEKGDRRRVASLDVELEIVFLSVIIFFSRRNLLGKSLKANRFS